MEPGFFSNSPFLPVIGWSTVLLLVHILLQANLATKELGIHWNAGPRDAGQQPTGVLAERAARASHNFRETYPAFIALALALLVKGETQGLGPAGAWIWFACRVIYIPLYLAGIPYIRSLVWLGSLIGLALMFWTLMV